MRAPHRRGIQRHDITLQYTTITDYFCQALLHFISSAELFCYFGMVDGEWSEYDEDDPDIHWGYLVDAQENLQWCLCHGGDKSIFCMFSDFRNF